MSRDIGDSRWTSPDTTYVAWDPGHRPGSRGWLRQWPRSGSTRWVERASLVPSPEFDHRDLARIDDGQHTASGWAAPIMRWGCQLARRRVRAPFMKRSILPWVWGGLAPRSSGRCRGR